jgi:hypothetical protein
MSRDNFYYNVDHDGKMPTLSFGRPEKRHFVRYENNRPVEVRPYRGQDRLWDYAACEMLALHPGVTGWDGKPLPVYQGRIVQQS